MIGGLKLLKKLSTVKLNLLIQGGQMKTKQLLLWWLVA